MNNDQLIQYAELWAVDPGEKMLIANWSNQVHGITLEAFDMEKERPRDGMKLINIFLGQVMSHILRLSAAVKPPFAPPPPVLPDGFSSNEDYILCRQRYYRHALNCFKSARDRFKAELIEQMLDNSDDLLKYFPDHLQIVQFYKVLDSCFLIKDKNLRPRMTKELKQVFMAACDKGFTKENYNSFPQYQQMEIIKNVSIAFGGKDLSLRALKDAFGDRDLKTYKRASDEFDNLPPD